VSPNHDVRLDLSALTGYLLRELPVFIESRIIVYVKLGRLMHRHELDVVQMIPAFDDVIPEKLPVAEKPLSPNALVSEL